MLQNLTRLKIYSNVTFITYVWPKIFTAKLERSCYTVCYKISLIQIVLNMNQTGSFVYLFICMSCID